MFKLFRIMLLIFYLKLEEVCRIAQNDFFARVYAKFFRLFCQRSDQISFFYPNFFEIAGGRNHRTAVIFFVGPKRELVLLLLASRVSRIIIFASFL